MQYTIRAPMHSFSGRMHGVRFSAGSAQAELSDDDVAWFREREYQVEEVVSPDASYPELQAEAKALGISASGKKEELAEAIANEKGRLAAEAQSGVAGPDQAAGSADNDESESGS